MHVSKQRRTPYRLHLHRNKSSQQKKKILFLWSNGRERTHTPILTFFLSHAVRMNERIGVVSAPLEGRVETKARVCRRRVRCRSQKGRAKRIETYLGGAVSSQGGLARPLWSMGPLFTIHANTTLPRFLFRPHCPPEQHMAALYSSSLSIFLSSRTNKSKHYRPCREYLLREDEYMSGLWLETFCIRFESFQIPFKDEGLWDIVRNLDIHNISIHMMIVLCM